ncbi:hypothetical protein evm_013849 [Chilo suppressalis]|nr:hypothetical protein evm_013849 [Chilo suppressalis]
MRRQAALLTFVFATIAIFEIVNETNAKTLLNKITFRRLCDDLKGHARLSGSSEIPLEIKVLCTLSFLATGSYQRIVGVGQYLTQRTTSRCIRENRIE